MSQRVRKSFCWHSQLLATRPALKKGTPPIVPTYPKQVEGGRVTKSWPSWGQTLQTTKFTKDSMLSLVMRMHNQLVLTQVGKRKR